MKKTILAVVAVFAFGFANAQDSTSNGVGFSEGDKFVEGSFRYSSQNGDSSPTAESHSWSLNPTVGYLLTDKWAVGGKLNFGGREFNNDVKTTDLGLTAFARYYFLSLGEGKTFNAYGEGGLGYTSSKVNNIIGNNTTDDNLNANISLGMNYFFNSNWAITFTLANILSYNSFSPENGDNENDLNIEVNLFNNIFDQPQFGLLYKW